MALVVMMGAFLLRVPPCLAEEASDLLVQGIRTRDRALETNALADWQQALSIFELAVEQNASPVATFELANAAVRLGLLDEAFQAYELALNHGMNPRAEAEAEAFVVAHAAEMARVDVIGPAGARVFVASHRRGRLPLAQALVVTAGSVHVRVEPEQGAPWETEVSLAPQQKFELRVPANAEVQSPRVEPAPAPAVVSSPVAFAGPDRVASPWADERSHTRWSTQRVAAVAMAGVGAGALILSGYTWWRANDLHSQALSKCSPPQCSSEARRLQESARDDARLTTMLLISGSVLLAGGGALFLTAPTNPKRIALVPVASQRSWGFLAHCQF
jgi:hypothetical protein